MRKSPQCRVEDHYQGAALELTRLYRRCLTDTHAVGITRSCGKTTAKDCGFSIHRHDYRLPAR